MSLMECLFRKDAHSLKHKYTKTVSLGDGLLCILKCVMSDEVLCLLYIIVGGVVKVHELAVVFCKSDKV